MGKFLCFILIFYFWANSLSAKDGQFVDNVNYQRIKGTQSNYPEKSDSHYNLNDLEHFSIYVQTGYPYFIGYHDGLSADIPSLTVGLALQSENEYKKATMSLSWVL